MYRLLYGRVRTLVHDTAQCKQHTWSGARPVGERPVAVVDLARIWRSGRGRHRLREPWNAARTVSC